MTNKKTQRVSDNKAKKKKEETKMANKKNPKDLS